MIEMCKYTDTIPNFTKKILECIISDVKVMH